MDVLLLAMECNDAAAGVHHSSSIGYIVPTQEKGYDEPTVLLKGSSGQISGGSSCNSNNYTSGSSNSQSTDFQHSSFTRKSCHRCGNIRKNYRKCPSCPHIICKNCVLKMSAMYEHNAFSVKSCPVCAFLCCCSNKSNQCANKYHCYRKCPVSRSVRKRQPQRSSAKYCHLTSNQSFDTILESGAASTAVDLDTHWKVGDNESEERQDDPDTELEDMACRTSPSISLSPFSPGSEISITTKKGTARDLKLPEFLSYGLLLSGVVNTTRSNAPICPSFASRGAIISCDNKMPGDHFFYSI